MSAFRVLARMRRFRGTALDVFGRTAERRMQRGLIGEYEQLVDELLRDVTPAKHALAVQLAELPLQMRGYGPVLERNVEAARVKQVELLAQFRGAVPMKPIRILAAA